MATILFAWELGANLGHLVPMSRIAAELTPEGHRFVYAVRDLKHAAAILGSDATILQAPVWPDHRHFGAGGGLASYADILTAIGFGDPAKLVAMSAAWRSLIELVRPDMVVADHSPGLQFALYGGDIPVLSVGSCFTMPPLGYGRFPPLRSDLAPAIPEGRLLDSARRAQTVLGRKLPGELTSIFETQQRVVFGLLELDPYRSYRRELIAAPPGGLPPPLPRPEKDRLFAYIGGDLPEFEPLMQALVGLDMPVEVYLRGEVGPILVFLRMRGITVHDTPPPLADVLARTSHVLTQGGAMTAAAVFTAGRPHLIAPNQDETRITLDIIQRLGVGKLLKLGPDRRRAKDSATEKLADYIQTFVSDLVTADNAMEQARRLAARPLPDGAKVGAEAIRNLLGAVISDRRGRCVSSP